MLRSLHLIRITAVLLLLAIVFITAVLSTHGIIFITGVLSPLGLASLSTFGQSEVDDDWLPGGVVGRGM